MSDARVRTLLVVVVTALATASCGGGGGSETKATGASERLVVLSDLAPVAKAFDADRGRPRLVLLLSPT